MAGTPSTRVQRLGAVVPGADGDALLVEDGGQVVGVDVGQGERHRPAAIRDVGGAVHGEAGHLGEALQGVAR